MSQQIKMPQLGESVVEGTITKWLKQEGDTVQEDELLVEVSTDKVDSEVPSSASGKLLKILVPEGETVNVGTPIAEIGEAGEQPAADQPDKEPEAEHRPQAEAAPDQVGEAAEDQAVARQATGQAGEAPQSSDRADGAQPEEEAPAAAATAEPAQRPQPERRPSSDGDRSKRGIISPLVRRLADEHGVDLGDVDGTGTGGRIRKQDVLRHVEERHAAPAARPAASAEPAPRPDGEEGARPGRREELVPWTNIRRRTAEHMVASVRETARAWNAVEVDWTNIVKLREAAKGPFRRREGFNLTYMAFLAKALCETLKEMPEVNAMFDEANEANLVRYYVNLGIAVALEGGGLIVPVVKAADEKNLVGLARGIDDVVSRARTKRLSPDDLAGGTFTITNPGPFGSVISVPIIPRNQTAIVGFESIRKGLVVTDDDQIAIRHLGILDMSWDHRAIDGAEAARFLALLKQRLETTDYSADLSPYLDERGAQ